MLGGCAAGIGAAVYEHPVSGHRVECVKPRPTAGGGLWYGLLDIPALDLYNACKSGLESKGYERRG